MPDSLLGLFEEHANRTVLARHRLRAKLERNRTGSWIILVFPKKHDSGFDIKLVCEKKRIYPFAGPYYDGVWEAGDDKTSEEVCMEAFGLVRMMLSTDAQLRITYRHNSICCAQLELRHKDGWRVFGVNKRVVLPIGKTAWRVFQNDVLHGRHPYDGMRAADEAIYYWEQPSPPAPLPGGEGR